MNNKTVGIAVLIAALVAGIFWWTGRSKSTPASADNPEISDAPAQAQERSGSAMAFAGGAPTQREADPTGSLRLEGQVIDESEVGIAGAQVALSSMPPRFARTEEDGSFAFEGLARKDYQLEAHRDGQYAAPVAMRLHEDSEPVILRMTAGRSLEVVVMASDAKTPVKDAEVEIRSGMDWYAGLRWRGQTNAAGHVELSGLPMSEVVLLVQAPGFASYSGRLPAVLQGKGAEHRIVLRPGVAVHGRVIDVSGKPVVEARVAALPAAEPFPLVDPRRDGAVTDSEGRFKLPDQMPGSYRFVISHPTMLAQNMSPISLTPHTSPIQLVAMTGASLRGTVVDAGGAPVVGADVGYVVQGSVPWRTRRRAVTDERGGFLFTALHTGDADVVATSSSASSEIVVVLVRAGEEASVAIELTLAKRIHGIVVNAQGDVVPEAQVLLEPVWTGAVGEHNQWQARDRGLAIANGGGVFEFTGLPAGPYELRAALPGASASSLHLATAMPASPGTTDYQLLVSGEVTVSGQLLYSDGGPVPLFTIALGAGRPTAFADLDGKFAMRMPAGEHELRFSGPSFAPKLVTANAPGDHDLGSVSVDRGRSIAGLVVDEANRPVESAEVAAGALLTGDGNKLFIEDESIMARTTRTDAHGRFAFDGFGPHPITVIAGLEGTSRSRALQIPAGAAGAEVTLSLEPTASLSGTILKDGKPVAETVVIATPIGTTSTSFVVTGPDGSYAYDALHPGEYIVYPMIGGGGGRPKDMFIKTVEIRSESAIRNIDIVSGAAQLAVRVLDAAGKPAAAQVLVFSATRAPEAPRTLDAFLDGSWLRGFDPGDEAVAVYLRGAIGDAATVDTLVPGRYSACAGQGPRQPGPPGGEIVCGSIDVKEGAPASLELRLPADQRPQ